MRIGVDILGGDFFPQAPVEGAVRFLKQHGNRARLVLIGDEKLILAELARQGASPVDFDIVHTEEYIGMEDSPTQAIKAKPRSTINIGIQMVKEKKLDGFVSAGNTGAMLVASIFGLGTIPGVSRPTIGVLFPNHENHMTMLCDVGANVDCKPETLRHFALLGSIFMTEVMKIENPRVALMNIGEEESKGNASVQAAFQLLKETPQVNFTGNAEGRDLYMSLADVYVCDGFTGNIVLKFGESLYNVLKTRYKSDDFIESFNFENYGGVPVLGVKGISMIGHGISSGKAIEMMIVRAIEAAESDLLIKIEEAFQVFAAESGK
jgi:phosphate acyltransferase